MLGTADDKVGLGHLGARDLGAYVAPIGACLTHVLMSLACLSTDCLSSANVILLGFIVSPVKETAGVINPDSSAFVWELSHLSNESFHDSEGHVM